jgi:DNA-binding response OmpR family regulator
VLVIDDEVDLAEAASMVLEWAGHTAEVWSSREPVMQAVRRFRPDVVLLDWVLGGQSGGEVMDELRAHPEINVVVMSALHGLESTVRVMGARGFLKKPFEPTELVRAVEACAPIQESPTMPP